MTQSRQLLRVAFLLDSFFDLEAGGRMFLKKVQEDGRIRSVAFIS
jgi:hypothetical protein